MCNLVPVHWDMYGRDDRTTELARNDEAHYNETPHYSDDRINVRPEPLSRAFFSVLGACIQKRGILVGLSW